jgi:ABC-type bacteriocin/lantibiotic exporter with double-glycine peptidase domain
VLSDVTFNRLFTLSKVEYITVISIYLLNTGLNLLSPYLVSQIIDFIETKDSLDNPPDISTGFIFVALLVVTQGLFHLI